MTISSDIWKQRLLTLQKELEALELDASDSRKTVELDQSKVGRLSRIDAMQAQAMNKAVSARRKAQLHRIASALSRIDEEEYGYCLECGDTILEKRLELDPTTTLCTSCQT